MKKAILILFVSLPLLAQQQKKGPLSAKALHAKQDAAFCKMAKMPAKARKVHGCK